MTRPALHTILLDGLAFYFQGGNKLDPKEYPVEFRRLVRQQNKIGWEQVFSGRFSKLWARHQHSFYKANKLLKKKRNGHLWMVAVTTKIWTEWYKIWEARNGVVHGHDLASKNIIKREKAVKEIAIIYSKRDHMLPADRDHLFPTLTQHLTKSTTALENWLNTFRVLFRSSISRAKRSAARGTLSIRDYFTRQVRDAVP